MLRFKVRGEHGEVFYATKDSAGFDICSQESYTLQPGERKLFSTGLYIDTYNSVEQAEIGGVKFRILPYLAIHPRSGLAHKHGIGMPTGVSVIDADYSHEIKVSLVNNNSEPFEVKSGDRIAQGVCSFCIQNPTISVKQATRDGGFGSTGV